MIEFYLITSTVFRTVIEVFFIIALGFVFSHPRFLFITPEAAVSITNLLFFAIFPLHVFFTAATSFDVYELDNLWYVPITTMLCIFFQYLLSEFLFRFNCIQAICFEPKSDQAIHLQVSSTTVPQYFVLPYAIGMRMLPVLFKGINSRIGSDVIETEFEVISSLFMLPYLVYLFSYVVWYVKYDPTTSEQHWMKRISHQMTSENEKDDPTVRTMSWFKERIRRRTIHLITKLQRIYLPIPIVFFLFGVAVSSIPPEVTNKIIFFEKYVPLKSFLSEFIIPLTNSTFVIIGLFNIGCQLGTFYYERRIHFERKRRALFSLEEEMLLFEAEESEEETDEKEGSEVENMPVERKLEFDERESGEQEEGGNSNSSSDYDDEEEEEDVLSNSSSSSDEESGKKGKSGRMKKLTVEDVTSFYSRSFLERVTGFETLSKKTIEKRKVITLQLLEEYTSENEDERRTEFTSSTHIGAFDRLHNRVHDRGYRTTVCGLLFEVLQSLGKYCQILKNRTIRYNSWLVTIKSVGGKLILIPFLVLVYVICLLYYFPNFFMFCSSYDFFAPSNPKTSKVELEHLRRFMFGFVVVLYSCLPADMLSLKMIIQYFFFFQNNSRGMKKGRKGILRGKSGMELKSFCELVLVQYILAPITISMFLIGFLVLYFSWFQSFGSQTLRE